ncbi:MAG: DUF3037 domain-containing protein [Armatimonadetes bacterium]|nr:DUF3037 domain-containing protein [Armatimonadota bacterium]
MKTTSQSAAKGYYSIVQYVPDIERTEGINIGIVLFCPEKNYLQVQLSSTNDRIGRFFESKKEIGLNLARIKVLKQGFEERIAFEKGRIANQEDFGLFVASRGNHLLLTEPRPIKIIDPNIELEQLFNRLVGSSPTRTNDNRRLKLLQKQFERYIADYQIGGLVQRNVELNLPTLGRTEKFPYGFCNGQENVIKPVVFVSTERSNVNRACVLAMEGRDLATVNIKLNVLADLNVIGSDHIYQTLTTMGVALHPADHIEEFVQEIKKSAH